jgi:hypothetical protein
LIKLHVLHNLEGQREVAEKNVHPQETDNAEIPEVAIQRPSTILADDLSGIGSVKTDMTA